MQRIGQIHVP